MDGKSCYTCKYKNASPEREPCNSCNADASNFEPEIQKTQTNRQWLESLSDEELAKKSVHIFTTILTTVENGVPYPVYTSSLPNSNKALYPNKEQVVEENLLWLRAEHKEVW